jgi:hypothetical protein
MFLLSTVHGTIVNWSPFTLKGSGLHLVFYELESASIPFKHEMHLQHPGQQQAATFPPYF